MAASSAAAVKSIDVAARVAAALEGKCAPENVITMRRSG